MIIEFDDINDVFFVRTFTEGTEIEARIFKSIRNMVRFCMIIGENWGQIYSADPIINIMLDDPDIAFLNGSTHFLFCQPMVHPQGQNDILKNFEMNADIYNCVDKKYLTWIYVEAVGGTRIEEYHDILKQMIDDIIAFFDYPK